MLDCGVYDLETVFYGSAIQGEGKRGARINVHRDLIQAVKDSGYNIATEHTSSIDKAEAMNLLEQSIGKLLPVGEERTKFIRDKMIDFVEGDMSACIFELSAPSIGTGIEFAHAYLRKRLGLKQIPILVLYEKDFWPNGLSSMVWGVKYGGFEGLHIFEYESLNSACDYVKTFLSNI